MLEAAVDGTVESLIDEQVGCLSAQAKRSARVGGGGFFAAAAQRQQRDHVGFRKLRLGLPSGLQSVGSAGIPAELHGDVVVAQAGGCGQVDDGLRLGRIREGDIATLQAILGSVERNFSFQNFYSSQDCRTVGGATHPEVRVTREAGDGGLHLQFGCGNDVNVELEAALQTIGLGYGDPLSASFDIGSEIESGSDRQLGDHNVAAQHGGICCTGQPEIGVGGGAYTRGIAQANIVRRRSKIDEEAAVLV